MTSSALNVVFLGLFVATPRKENYTVERVCLNIYKYLTLFSEVSHTNSFSAMCIPNSDSGVYAYWAGIDKRVNALHACRLNAFDMHMPPVVK